MGVDKKSQRAQNCRKCGKCESMCPQKINIRDDLEKVNKTFGENCSS